MPRKVERRAMNGKSDKFARISHCSCARACVSVCLHMLCAIKVSMSANDLRTALRPRGLL